MRKLLVVIAVALAALVVAAPASAWPIDLPWWTPATDFTAAGKAKAVDATNGRLVVRVQLASAGVAHYLGEDLTVTTTPDTQILLRKGLGFKAIGLADIALDDHVRAVGLIDRSDPADPSYVATRLIVRHPVPAEGLTRFACRGPVVATDAGAATITIRLRLVTRALWRDLGHDFTFAVAPGAKVFTVVDGVVTPLGLDAIAAGRRVTAQGSIDRTVPDAPVFRIKWMRVAPLPAPAAP